MIVLRPVVILTSVLMLGGSALAQLQLTPQAADAPSKASKRVKTKTIKPTLPKKEAVKPAKAATTPDKKADAQVLDNPNADLVYGAYQRGMYKTAFDLAMKRAQENKDPAAMTMLGELYANALGAKRDYGQAIQWYQRATDLGDREAMFALAMLRIGGRGGPPDSAAGAKLLASSAKLGEPKAAYNLALLYMDGQTLPQDFKRAAELLRFAADAGSPEAQYALATFYKEGRGVEKNLFTSVRLLQAASLAGNVDAEVEYAIALFNGTGTEKNEAAAVSLLRKAARQNSAIAQNRLARVLVTGMGAPMDKVEGLKWHIVAKTAGKGDLMLDEALAQATPEERAKAQDDARKWLGVK
ncbi:MAG: tetratricopeptide repeat protein [Nitrobacter sp.]